MGGEYGSKDKLYKFMSYKLYKYLVLVSASSNEVGTLIWCRATEKPK